MSRESNSPVRPIHIRAADTSDIPAILALANSVTSAAHWPAQIYAEMFSANAPARLILIAENEQKKLHGFAVARFTADECELENIVVRPESQRCGIGRKLLAALLESARAKGATRMFLEVRESNRAARALYEKCEFTESGRRADYYSSPKEDALIYQISLSPASATL